LYLLYSYSLISDKAKVKANTLEMKRAADSEIPRKKATKRKPSEVNELHVSAKQDPPKKAKKISKVEIAARESDDEAEAPAEKDEKVVEDGEKADEAAPAVTSRETSVPRPAFLSESRFSDLPLSEGTQTG
jgi:hypothetical protein